MGIRIVRSVSSGILLIALILLSFPSMANNLENLAKSLAKIRGEVETLQIQLDMEKEKHSSRTVALNSQLADLSVEERRQKLSVEKLQNSLEKLTESTQKAEQSSDKLKPVLLTILNDYKNYIQAGFPFKKDDRLKAVTNLENSINNQLIDPNKAINQAWALVEDEVRLSKENGIYQQTVELNGENLLVDIAKLGTVFLFFQTRDNRSGMAKRSTEGNWKFEVVNSADDVERIKILFDSLKKQIRQGYFEIPNPLRK
ncbi:protein of unknown function [Nitrosomonas sp. PY1]|uniref:DUF3450 family protein n=1 Tax=Nitrosomonas sp. PY1 TaxID=1803906 RepID=UPI001FC7D724|nr:DUF3450 family protein [Nitrosomonas sp. PY1]GKS69491.1 protein of unknown function [Nitrosomonas sp. PY1]